MADINKIRGVFEEYLRKLVLMNVISKDDQATYAEVYPLFDPYFVSYDKGVSAYEDLRDVSKHVFSLGSHLEKQIHDVERIIDRSLENKEKVCFFIFLFIINLFYRCYQLFLLICNLILGLS